MIQKPTVSKVMKTFEDAVKESETLKTSLDDTKAVLEKELKLMDAQYEYVLNELMNIKSRPAAMDGKIIFSEEEKYGQFDSYGLTVHPKLAKEPRNLFNYLTSHGYLFKSNVKVTVNGVEDTVLKEALKHDSCEGKDASIEYFTTDTLDITIEPNLKTPLGSLKCNMIEFLPFLPGSFNIENIKIYSREDIIYPAHELSGGIMNVGSQRVILSSKADIGKVEMRVKLIYKNSEGKFPFGLRHLYFLEASFMNNSYVVVRTDRDNDIEYIYDGLSVKSQYGSSRDESSKEWGITYYARYDSGALTHQIETSTTKSPSVIPLNTKSVFIRVPLTSAIISMTPDIRTVKN